MRSYKLEHNDQVQKDNIKVFYFENNTCTLPNTENIILFTFCFYENVIRTITILFSKYFNTSES